MSYIFAYFMARYSAETSAEDSVDLAEASVSAESRFRAFRSFTMNFPLFFHMFGDLYQKII